MRFPHNAVLLSSFLALTLMLQACNTASVPTTSSPVSGPSAGLPTDAGLLDAALTVPTSMAENASLAGVMQAAQAELKGENGLYRTADGLLGIRYPEKLSRLALNLAQSGQKTVAEAVGTGSAVLSDDLYLTPVSTVVTSQWYTRSGRFWGGMWVDVYYSNSEVNSFSAMANILGAVAGMYGAAPVAGAFGILSGVAAWCNNQGQGVVLHSGVTYGNNWAYCWSQ